MQAKESIQELNELIQEEQEKYIEREIDYKTVSLLNDSKNVK